MRRNATIVMVLGAVALMALLAAHPWATESKGAGPAAGLGWAADLPSALGKARTENKLVMVDFYTDWCAYCEKFDRTTLRDAEVQHALGSVVPVKLNAESDGRGEAERFGVDGYPTILFLDGSGNEVGRIPGYLPATAFLEEFRDILRKGSLAS
ncbi:MAG: thioredoxin family protein [Acidobacteriota bacterium]